jgi:hypothetical protein
MKNQVSTRLPFEIKNPTVMGRQNFEPNGWLVLRPASPANCWSPYGQMTEEQGILPIRKLMRIDSIAMQRMRLHE